MCGYTGKIKWRLKAAKGISVVWYSSVKRLGCCDLVLK